MAGFGMKKSLSILVPTYNEQHLVCTSLQRLTVLEYLVAALAIKQTPITV